MTIFIQANLIEEKSIDRYLSLLLEINRGSLPRGNGKDQAMSLFHGSVYAAEFSARLIFAAVLLLRAPRQFARSSAYARNEFQPDYSALWSDVSPPPLRRCFPGLKCCLPVQVDAKWVLHPASGNELAPPCVISSSNNSILRYSRRDNFEEAVIRQPREQSAGLERIGRGLGGRI